MWVLSWLGVKSGWSFLQWDLNYLLAPRREFLSCPSTCPSVGHRSRLTSLRSQTSSTKSKEFSIIFHYSIFMWKRWNGTENSEYLLPYVLRLVKRKYGSGEKKRYAMDSVKKAWEKMRQFEMLGTLKHDLRDLWICKQGCYYVRKWLQNWKFETKMETHRKGFIPKK